MEKKFDDLVLPNKNDTIITKTIGAIVMILTIGTGFIFCYGALLARRDYYNRKALLEYIKKNGTPEPIKDISYSTFYFGDVRITRTADRWYGEIGYRSVISSFCSDMFDQRRYEEIDAILKAAT